MTCCGAAAPLSLENKEAGFLVKEVIPTKHPVLYNVCILVLVLAIYFNALVASLP